MKIPGVNAGLSGLQANANKMAVSADNIANSNTPGFKANQAVLQSLPSNLGVVTSAIRQVMASGSPIYTGNPLDAAIQGEGFFSIALPNGKTAFTRQGSFQKDNQGRLTLGGSPVKPEIRIPQNATSVGIGADGTITATVDGKETVAGKLQLASFGNPGGLQALGGGFYSETAQSGAPLSGGPGGGGMGSLVPNSLEDSNVDLASEIVNTIMAKQGYSASAKMVKAADEMTGALLNIKT